MAQIHPSAIVDSQAQLASSVVVGPGCVIVGRVTIGEGTRLIANVYLEGPLTIGRDCTLYPFVCLGMAPQDRKFDPAQSGAGLTIGDGNVLRESVTIHRATGDRSTTVGDRNYFMANSHAGHDCVIGNDCTFANGVLLAGHVTVSDNVTIGGNAAVHQFCRIGRLVMLSGVVAITQDVPPFCVAYSDRRVGSLNVVGLRRAGLRDHLQPLKRAFHILFRERHSNNVACDRIEAELGDNPLCAELAAFVRGSKRGISPYQHIDAAGSDTAPVR